jgi:hypothetical protein
VDLGQRAEHREVGQPWVGVQVDIAGQRPEQLQGGAFRLPDGGVVDQAVVGRSRSQGVHLCAQRRIGPPVLAGVGHPQVERVGEPAAGRRVGRRRHRQRRRDRVQRVEQDQSRAVAVRHEVAQVAQVAHAPGAGRPQGVELQHPAPRLRRLGKFGRHHHQGDVLVVGGQPVPADRQRVRDLGDAGQRRSVLQRDGAGLDQWLR